jgi:protein SCO1
MNRLNRTVSLSVLCLFLSACRGERLAFQEMPLGFTSDTSLVSDKGTRERLIDSIKPVTLLFFGFTHCPDFCPMTLHKIHSALSGDVDLQKKLALLFVTVDPQNDTPEVLKSYLSAFPYARGFTGDPAELKRLEKSFGAFSKPTEKTISHSLYVYLMNAQGKVIYLIRSDESQEKLKKILHQAAETHQ